MNWIRFFLKVCSICNGCFLAACLLRFVHVENWPDIIIKTIAVLGLVLAMPLGIAVYLVLAMLLLLKKIKFANLQKWLFAVNLLVLIIEVIYLFT
jgi:hypothetical protein